MIRSQFLTAAVAALTIAGTATMVYAQTTTDPAFDAAAVMGVHSIAPEAADVDAAVTTPSRDTPLLADGN